MCVGGVYLNSKSTEQKKDNSDTELFMMSDRSTESGAVSDDEDDEDEDDLLFSLPSSFCTALPPPHSHSCVQSGQRF